MTPAVLFDWAVQTLVAFVATIAFSIIFHTPRNQYAFAGITGAVEAVRVGVIGGLLFTALAYLYTAIRERLVTSSAGILAPVCVGFVMYLACQGFMSILL